MPDLLEEQRQAAYYADEHVTIYHGDCQTILPTLPRDSVDLIVTDPPYGQSWQSGRRMRKQDPINGDDGSLDVADALRLALRTLRNRRHIYIFGRVDLTALPIGGTCDLIWDKLIIGPGDLTQPWGPQHEPITFGVHCTRPANRAAGDGRLAARLRKGSVLRVQRANSGELEDGRIRHQAYKPVLLLRQLIESSSLIGETVLDPFMGSGYAARGQARGAQGDRDRDRRTPLRERRRVAQSGASSCLSITIRRGCSVTSRPTSWRHAAPSSPAHCSATPMRHRRPERTPARTLTARQAAIHGYTTLSASGWHCQLCAHASGPWYQTQAAAVDAGRRTHTCRAPTTDDPPANPLARTWPQIREGA